MIAELLDGAPTRSGTFGREAAAARALARDQDLRAVAERLEEARQAGSSAAGQCLIRLEEGVLRPETTGDSPTGIDDRR
jgi:hypothetical protein